MSQDLPNVFDHLFPFAPNTPARADDPLKPLEQEMRRQRKRLLAGERVDGSSPLTYRRAAQAARELSRLLERLAHVEQS
jgi:hypothetical protein